MDVVTQLVCLIKDIMMNLIIHTLRGIEKFNDK
jgi:hypothetical protein